MDTAASAPEVEWKPAGSFSPLTLGTAGRRVLAILGGVALGLGLWGGIAAAVADGLSARDVELFWRLAPPLIAFGAGLLLIVGGKAGFLVVAAGAGAGLYISENVFHWAPAGWSTDLSLAGVTLVAMSVALITTGRPVRTGAVFFALLVVVGVSFGNLSAEASTMIRSLIVILTVVWACLRVRSGLVSRTGSQLAYGGAALFIGEQLWHWSPPGWHPRVLAAASVLIVVGMLAHVCGYVIQDAALDGFGVAVLWVIAATWGVGHWRQQLDLGAATVAGARIAAIAVGVLGAAALTTAAVQFVVDYRGTPDRRKPIFICSVWFTWTGIAVAVVALSLLAEFGPPVRPAGALLIVVCLGFAVALTAIWAIVVVAVDPSYAARLPAELTVGDLQILVRRSILEGPRGTGKGPFLALTGAVAIALLSGWLQFFAAGVFIFGAVEIAYFVMRRIGDRPTELDPGDMDEAEELYWSRQSLLVPLAVGGGLAAIVLEFTVSATDPHWFGRLLATLAAALGFTAVALPIAHMVLDPGLRRAGLALSDLDFDLQSDLGRAAAVAAGSPLLGILSMAVLLTFDPGGAGKGVFGVLAAVAFVTAFLTGGRLLSKIAGRDADDLVRRLDRLARGPRPAQRLIPLVMAPDRGSGPAE